MKRILLIIFIVLSMLTLPVVGAVIHSQAKLVGTKVMKVNQTIQVEGKNVSYRMSGEGAPLILLQRFRGAMNDWDPALIEALSVSNKVIIFDSFGVGDSEGDIPETLEGAADIVILLMDSLGLDKANILGWSLGGMTAQILAIKHSDRIDKVILAGTTPPMGRVEVERAPEEWTAVATKPFNTAEDMAYLFYTESSAGQEAAEASRKRFEVLDEKGVTTKTSPAIIMKQAMAARGYLINQGKWFERLGGIEVPVLVANGESDLAFPVINSKVLHQEIPNSQLVIYPDAGHAFLFQYADQFSQDVSHFLMNH